MFVCRTSFLLLCAVPTFLLCGAAVRYRSPSYLEAQKEEWCAVLSEKLGLTVSVSALTYPHWNTALLEDLMLVDPETDEQVVSARYVEVTQTPQGWEISAGQPEIDAEALPLLIEVLEHRLLRGQALQLPPLSLNTRQLTFRTAEAAQTFEHVQVDVSTTEAGKRIHGAFQIAGLAAPATEFTIERLRKESPPKTICSLQASSALPSAPLSLLWPWLNQLGSDANFIGDAVWTTSRQETSLQLTGEFREIELEQLVANHLPQHTLVGRADVRFQPLDLRNGKIADLQGTLQTHGGGLASRELLEDLRTKLDLGPHEVASQALQPLVRFRDFAFGFRLDAAGLALTGFNDSVGDGVIMASASQKLPLLTQSDQAVVPAVNLIPLLSPDVHAPSTVASRALIDLLPLRSQHPQPRRPNVRLAPGFKGK